jgi:hypothetical protein
MKFIKDEDNICLRCATGEIYGSYKPNGAPCMLTWCGCKDVNLGGQNKGMRRQCKAFTPKTHEDGADKC